METGVIYNVFAALLSWVTRGVIYQQNVVWFQDYIGVLKQAPF